MDWKQLLLLTDEELDDPVLVKDFNLQGHPEFPAISELTPEETLEILREFLDAEGHPITIRNLLNYAPILEITLIRKNLPQIYG